MATLAVGGKMSAKKFSEEPLGFWGLTLMFEKNCWELGWMYWFWTGSGGTRKAAGSGKT